MIDADGPICKEILSRTGKGDVSINMRGSELRGPSESPARGGALSRGFSVV